MLHMACVSSPEGFSWHKEKPAARPQGRESLYIYIYTVYLCFLTMDLCGVRPVRLVDGMLEAGCDGGASATFRV